VVADLVGGAGSNDAAEKGGDILGLDRVDGGPNEGLVEGLEATELLDSDLVGKSLCSGEVSDVDEGVVDELPGDALSGQLHGQGVVTVEVELASPCWPPAASILPHLFDTPAPPTTAALLDCPGPYLDPSCIVPALPG
jgi:hypothetical protein